jgi:predicted transcriptional regulator
VRRIRGLTQHGLAEQTAIPRTYLAKLEAGLTVTMVDRVLHVLRRMGAEVTVSLRSSDDDAG